MKARSIKLSIPSAGRFGYGLSACCIALASLTACASGDEGTAFRGDEHETTSTASTASTGGETGKTETSSDTGKDVGDTGGETGGEGVCPRTQGYWKNHNVYAGPEQNQIPWPISEDTQLCGASWYEWLWTPPRGDAWIILVHQYIAASLNQAAGADVPADVQDALDAAAAYLDDCSISAADREDALEVKDILDEFNNGELTECEDGDDDGDDGDDGDGDGAPV